MPKFRKRKRKLLSCVPVRNVKLGTISRATTAKKCTKKRDARAKLLFCQSKPITFLPFSLPSSSSLLKFPIKVLNTLKFYRKGDKMCAFFVSSGPLYQAKAKSTRNRTFLKLHIFYRDSCRRGLLKTALESGFKTMRFW